MELLIVTGQSGAGKTRVINALEDIGYYCVDNIPPALLGDFADLVQTRLRANREYGDRSAFARKCILNLAHAGRFSSDRTVREYAENIWHLPLE